MISVYKNNRTFDVILDESGSNDCAKKLIYFFILIYKKQCYNFQAVHNLKIYS